MRLRFSGFHWEIEFPEVFSRDNPGFDAYVGNPPFLGGKRISTVQGDGYRDWLAELHEGACVTRVINVVRGWGVGVVAMLIPTDAGSAGVPSES